MVGSVENDLALYLPESRRSSPGLWSKAKVLNQTKQAMAYFQSVRATYCFLVDGEAPLKDVNFDNKR
jgi:hypothetical protein